MGCPHCKHLIVDSLDGKYIHQKKCPDYAGGVDADTLREKLRGIEVGSWADQVLEAHPKSTWIKEPDPSRADDDTLVVVYHYDGFDLTIAMGEHTSPTFGKMKLYAVQKIEVTDGN